MRNYPNISYIPGRCAFFKVKSEHALALEQLKVLDIGRCFFVADAEVKPFPRLPQLQELYLEVSLPAGKLFSQTLLRSSKLVAAKRYKSNNARQLF